MEGVKISTPSDFSVSASGAVGRVQWDSTFGIRRTADFGRVQRFIDSEVLRCTEPYVPFRTGMLARTGYTNTEIGSGQVEYGGPYAGRLYRHPEYDFDTSSHADAGAYWFERMKVDHRDDILRGARKEAGAK